jgi:hypothetical protein
MLRVHLRLGTRFENQFRHVMFWYGLYRDRDRDIPVYVGLHRYHAKAWYIPVHTGYGLNRDSGTL